MLEINQIKFGTFTDPKTKVEKPVIKFILRNDQNVVVEILNYGAIIASIQTPDKNNVRSSIVCGFDTFEGKFENFAATIWREI